MAPRRVSEGDLDRILEIERRSFGAYAYDRNLFAEYWNHCGEFFLVCESEGRVEGYLIGCARRDRAELISIAVDPAARGAGVASALLISLFRRLRARGVARISLMVRRSNLAAEALYRKHNFEKIRIAPGYYEDGTDGILMTRIFGQRK